MASVSMINGHIDPDKIRMTDKEIINAIEYCKNYEGNGCRGCVFYGNEKGACIDELLTNALDIINRQQETIETLRNCVKQHHIIRQDGKSPLSLLTAEIRAEAIKECLEWVLHMFPEDKSFTTISRFTINQKLKEMVGEQE